MDLVRNGDQYQGRRRAVCLEARPTPDARLPAGRRPSVFKAVFQVVQPIVRQLDGREPESQRTWRKQLDDVDRDDAVDTNKDFLRNHLVRAVMPYGR